jgi:uncharacterized protein YdaU (DUF1376 family)
VSAVDGMMLWTSKVLASTSHLTTIQFGARMRIVISMWRNGGSLSNDDVRLARIAGMPLDKWRKNRADVLESFSIDGDRIIDRELQEELEKTLGLIEKRRLAGRAGGNAKSLKNNQPDVASATNVPEQKVAVAPENESKNQNQNQIKKKDSGVGRKRGTRSLGATPLPIDWKPCEADVAFACSRGLSDSEIERNGTKFRNWHVDKQTLRRDWSKAWENWMLDTVERNEQRKPVTTGKPSLRDHFDAIPDGIEAGPVMPV